MIEPNSIEWLVDYFKTYVDMSKHQDEIELAKGMRNHEIYVEINKMHYDYVGEQFKDEFSFKATDGNGGIYEDTIKAMTFKHAAMYLQKTYHSVLKLERI